MEVLMQASYYKTNKKPHLNSQFRSGLRKTIMKMNNLIITHGGYENERN